MGSYKKIWEELGDVLAQEHASPGVSDDGLAMLEFVRAAMDDLELSLIEDEREVVSEKQLTDFERKALK